MVENEADPSSLLRDGAEHPFDTLDERRPFCAVSENLLGCSEDPATLDRFKIERRVGDLQKRRRGAPERIMVEGALSVVAAIRNDLPLADRRMTATIELAEREWGLDDRRIATFFVNHARILMEQGKSEGTASQLRSRLESAASQAQRGLDVETKVLGPEHEALADGLALLAEVRFLQGRAADAERLARRAFAAVSAPKAKLELRVGAMFDAAHAKCDATPTIAEVTAALDAADEHTSPPTMQGMRDRLQGLASSIADNPSCEVE